MNRRLIDTNVVSFFLRGDTRWNLYVPHLAGRVVAISFATVGELHEGAARQGWGAAKLDKLTAMLRAYLFIPATPKVCVAWGRIRAERRAQPLSENDAWIAACAAAYGCDLVTHDRGLAGIAGLDVITEREHDDGG